MLHKAIDLGRQFVKVTDEEVTIIKHCQGSILHYWDIWTQKGAEPKFYVGIEALADAKIAKVLEIYVPKKIAHIFDKILTGIVT